MKKYFLISIFLIFQTFFSFANDKNSQNPIQAYRKALNYYENNDYGKALKYSEDAILYKKQKIETELEILETSLSSKAVKSAGDNINQILIILKERNEINTINIINHYLKIKGDDFFDNSISKMLEYLQGTKVYPEAQKLIGDIYKLEGEYDFAETYYQMALKNKEYLDIPNEKYDILYMLSDISRLKGDENQMEIRLLNILTDDKIYNDNAIKSAIWDTLKTNKKSTVEKLFTLYRADSFFSLSAYSNLSEYYHEKGEIDKTLLFSTLFAITSFTKIYETLKLRNFDYEYQNLETFFQEASFYPDIVKWGAENNIWKSFNILARYANEYGYNVFAQELLKILAQYSPERYWQQEAVLQLEKLEN